MPLHTCCSLCATQVQHAILQSISPGCGLPRTCGRYRIDLDWFCFQICLFLVHLSFVALLLGAMRAGLHPSQLPLQQPGRNAWALLVGSASWRGCTCQAGSLCVRADRCGLHSRGGQHAVSSSPTVVALYRLGQTWCQIIIICSSAKYGKFSTVKNFLHICFVKAVTDAVYLRMREDPGIWPSVIWVLHTIR